MAERDKTPDILKTLEQEMDSDIHPVLKKILDNLKPIGLAVGGIVAAVAVYSGVTSYQESQHEKAVSELGTILVMSDAAQRMERLEAFAQSGPKSLHLAVHLELARLQMESGDFDKAVASWQLVGKDKAMTTVAGLGQAKALMLKGDYAQAVDILTNLKKNVGEELGAAISTNLAFAAEKAGQIDLAVAEYEALKSNAGGNEAFLEYKIKQLSTKPQS